MNILPDKYNIKYSIEITQDHTKLHINQGKKIYIFYKKIYTLIYTNGYNCNKTLATTTNNRPQKSKQLIILLNYIMEENYFQQ